MPRKEIVVLLAIVVGFLLGAIIAYGFFEPKTWSQAKSIIYLAGFIGGLVGIAIATWKGR